MSRPQIGISEQLTVCRIAFFGHPDATRDGWQVRCAKHRWPIA